MMMDSHQQGEAWMLTSIVDLFLSLLIVEKGKAKKSPASDSL